MVLLTKASQCAFALNGRILAHSVNSRTEPYLAKVARYQAGRCFFAPLSTCQHSFKPPFNVGILGHIDNGNTAVTSANSTVVAANRVAEFTKYESISKKSEEKMHSLAISYDMDYGPERGRGQIDCPSHVNSNNWWWRRRLEKRHHLVMGAWDSALPQTSEHFHWDIQLNELFGQFHPAIMPVVPIEAPSAFPTIEKLTMRRMLRVRRRKMKKHKRRKRYMRDFYKYATFHREKKAKAEKAFRYRMTDLLRELDTYDAEKYVRETIARAKVDPHEGLAWSGRKKHAHWSEVMTIEELYGLPKSDYIDKSAGYPDEEDAAEIARLKADYYRRFRGIELNVDDPNKTVK
uniref:Uncharacterized protein n=1 Tax=Plectus sambesii TaxID=2011161 RepID=A0A914WGG5_9BILA